MALTFLARMTVKPEKEQEFKDLCNALAEKVKANERSSSIWPSAERGLVIVMLAQSKPGTANAARPANPQRPGDLPADCCNTCFTRRNSFIS